MCNRLEKSVFHRQNENRLLEMKRQHANIIGTKFKSFTFIMTLIWTLFCTLIYAVRCYYWTLSSHFVKGKSSVTFLLVDATKIFLIYSSAFMVFIVIFLSLLSNESTKVDTDKQEILLSSQIILTNDTKWSDSNDRNSFLIKCNDSGTSNDLHLKNDNEPAQENIKNNTFYIQST